MKDRIMRNLLNEVGKKAASAAINKAERVKRVQQMLNSDPYSGAPSQGTGSSFMTGDDVNKIIDIADNSDIMAIIEILNSMPFPARQC